MPAKLWSFWGFIALLVLAHFIVHVAIGLELRLLPDFLTIAVLLSARRVRAPAAAGIGLAFGLLEDALALTGFGARAVAMAVIAFFGARSRDLFEGESVMFLAFYLFLGKWVRDAIVYLLTMATARGDVVTNLLVDGPIAALITAAAGTIAFLIYRALTGDR
jgi:rod shape-determining protein MreD